MTQIKYTKRIGHLFEKMIDRDNLKLAIQNAAKRKRNRASVRRVLNDIEKYTDKLYEILSSESFNPHQYTIREINDGIKKKKRIIAVPRFFPDQCIHHAFVQIFKEVVTHSAYEYSCGCVPGKGTDGARKSDYTLDRNRSCRHKQGRSVRCETLLSDIISCETSGKAEEKDQR